MDDLTMFYAWQSDRVKNDHQYFIRDAARVAIKRVRADGDIDDSPRLDSDTQNVAGTPEIAATIFGKIDKAGLFLGDVSFVSYVAPVNDASPKLLPNPNVLIELGYAAARLGWDRIICVINNAWGPSDDLPFDLRHRRWPVTYHLPEGASQEERKKQSEALAKGIEIAVKLAIQAEHGAVADIIGRLDIHCLIWMRELGNRAYFRGPERQTMGDLLSFQALDAALPRLLSLGILRCDVNPEGVLYAYHWTYIGKQVLRKLGFRNVQIPA
ncbi:MAG: hypothetical protein JWL59_1385 [Chthoniobacteraceae bacterium]|nr:hypothetical protein [Chthoniobacteraceae bacterium]